jgi:prophage DNA circulation protein
MNWSAVGISVSVFLAIFGSIMGSLSWFFRERLRLIEKENDRTWKEIETLRSEHKKYVDWIDQRLHAGSEAMTAIKASITDMLSEGVNVSTFDLYQKKNDEEHRDLKKSLDKFNEHVQTLLATVAGIEQFVKGNLESVHSLLAKKTVIGNADQMDLIERRKQ